MVELPRLARRRNETHKGDYGRVLCIAGSAGMTGAAALTGSAAIRGGAGLVYVAVPRSCWQVVAAADRCYLTIPLPEDIDGRIAPAALDLLDARRASMEVVAVGPGLGRSTAIERVVQTAFESWEQPLVVDADAVNALSRCDSIGPPAGPRILTPHPGEFARVAPGLPADPQGAAELANRHDSVVVLKGHRTIVTDGTRVYRNTTGNPGMATGGSGDVLTGLIAALVGQGLAPFDSACLGVYIHGLAGDLAARSVGMVSLCATDLLEYLPAAIQDYQHRSGDV